MQLSSDEFWGMSPAEFALARKGHVNKCKMDLRNDLMCSYYSGAMSQADIKKNKINKFLDGIDEWLFPEKMAKQKEDDLIRLKKLWDSKIN